MLRIYRTTSAMPQYAQKFHVRNFASMTACGNRFTARAIPNHYRDFASTRRCSSSTNINTENNASTSFPLVEKTGNAMVDSLNQALASYPLATSLSFIYSPIAVAGLLFGVLSIPPLTPTLPPQLAIAFGINRATTRLRVPIILALSAVVARLFPTLTRVPIAKLLAMPLKQAQAEAEAMAATTSAGVDGSTSVKVYRGLGKAMDFMNMGGIMDKYGLAYVLTGRFVATCSILTLTAVLQHPGLDIQWLLDWVGEDVNKAAGWVGRWTAACLMVNVTFPLVLKYAVADVAMWAGKLEDAYEAEAAAKTNKHTRAPPPGDGKVGDNDHMR